MKLSEYINNLQSFLEENGDMECYYAKDAEGNGYCTLSYSGTLMFAQELEYYADLISTEDAEEYDDQELTRVCVVN